MPNIYITSSTSFCENNFHILAKIDEFMRGNGHTIVRSPDKADYIIILTCGYLKYKEDQALKMIEDLSKFGRSKIVVTGCLPNIVPSLRKEYTCVNVDELEKFNSLFNAPNKIEGFHAHRFVTGTYPLDHDANSYYIKICQGCTHKCSYCAVRVAKGYVKSEPIDSIVRQFTEGISRGIKEFRLLGDDCSSYGIDIGTDLIELLEALLLVNTSNAKIHLVNFHPAKLVEMYPRLTDGIIKMLCHITVPIQSTSSRVLGLMNRECDIDRVIEIVRELKRINPEICVPTAVIFGFPTETLDDIRGSFRVADVFDVVSYFYYSERGDLAHLKPLTKEELDATISLIKEAQLKKPNIYLFTEVH